MVELIDELDHADERVEQQRHYGLFVWPSALVLAQFVALECPSWQGKVVLELGCGTALPGILAGRCGTPRKVRILAHRAIPKKC